MAVERYVLVMPEPRAVRPFAEHHEEWSAHLRRHVVSRRTLFKGAITSVTAAAFIGARELVGTGHCVRRDGSRNRRGRFPRERTAPLVRRRTDHGNVGRRPVVQPESVQRGPATFHPGLARLWRHPSLRKLGGNRSPRTADPRSGVERATRHPQGISDIERRSILRPCPSDRS